jgi:transcription-repair coupling factor (superfamily II helicase)
MALKSLSSLAQDVSQYRDLCDMVKNDRARVVQLEGISAPAKGFFLAKLLSDINRKLVLITYTSEQADRLATDLIEFGIRESDVALLPATADNLLFTEGAPDYAAAGKRISTLEQILAGDYTVAVGTLAAFLQRTAPAALLTGRDLVLNSGESRDVANVLNSLMALGYERVESVEQVGQWTQRGGLVDIYPGDMARPVRVDFFGDDIESIRSFDPETQRSRSKIDSITIRPVREIPIDNSEIVSKAIGKIKSDLSARQKELRAANLEGNGEEHAIHLEERVEGDIVNLSQHTYFDQVEAYIPYLYPDTVCALDFLTPSSAIVIDEPHQAKARWDQSEKELLEIAHTRALRGEWLQDALPIYCTFDCLNKYSHAGDRAVILLSLLARPLEWMHSQRDIAISVPPIESFQGRMPALYESLEAWLSNHLRCVVVTRQPDRIREMLREHNIAVAHESHLKPGQSGAEVNVLTGTLSAGFKLPDSGLMVLTDADIFGSTTANKIKRRSGFKDGLRISSYLELRVGDYVVHVNHGIGRYRGLTRLKGNDGADRDYLLLEYAAGDKVYVPTDQVDRVQRYIGSDADSPTISRLNSGEWLRATRAAKKQVQEMAGELIKLYAARRSARRPPCIRDTPWQEEMENAFPYEETPGQLSAVQDIKHDLEQKQPMDRLICGDVGFGKTEVAMRAAFKVVNSGRQVIVLCPTTILAQQHLNTFRERMAAYPVRIEMLSRFVSRTDAAKITKDLEDGKVDIVVGTHRLLSKDVKAGNLGLLIVDEEQRFGVTHKEKIKQLKKSVDVLTLTATPIPRTLHMALSGIRDLSLINDPPEGRMPIKTYIREYDDELVREVVLRELDRGGQIYFVSNRIESIYHMAEKLNRLVPYARVGVGHGQMHEHELEDVMLKFYHKEYDILVCTTIIESGLDVSNVNTIVVDNADRMGLGQLYQLRGRVGRSSVQGYAYLLYRRDKILSEVAEKRLSALRDFSDLGSGYKVALRDLEIRGAGNLLGAEQSGTVSAVGFDLYTQLLSQAINELKGEPAEVEFILPSVNLPLDAHIPTKYIPSEAERILIYKKLTAVRRTDDVAEIQAELEDRYGDPPRSVWNLLSLLRLRLRCLELRIGSIMTEQKTVQIRFKGTHLTTEAMRPLTRKYVQFEFHPDRVVMPLPESPGKTLTAVEELVEVLANALPDKDKEARIGVSHGNGPALPPGRGKTVRQIVGYRK